MNNQKITKLFTTTVFTLLTITGCGVSQISTSNSILDNNVDSDGYLHVLNSTDTKEKSNIGEPKTQSSGDCKKPPTGNAPSVKPTAPPPPPKNNVLPLPSSNPNQPIEPQISSNTNFSVSITGGSDTEPRDGGRPVVLIAAGLGVPTEVFRTAFSFVTPASGGQEPDPTQVNLNKKALLNVLAPYGITNDFLDNVSDYYRFSGVKGQTWTKTPATAKAIVTDGVVTGINITNAGSGYSSVPKISISGAPNIIATATLSFGKDLKTNGSISSISISNK